MTDSISFNARALFTIEADRIYHFERLRDLQMAFEHLGTLLCDKLEMQIRWDEQKKGFVKNA